MHHLYSLWTSYKFVLCVCWHAASDVHLVCIKGGVFLVVCWFFQNTVNLSINPLIKVANEHKWCRISRGGWGAHNWISHLNQSYLTFEWRISSISINPLMIFPKLFWQSAPCSSVFYFLFCLIYVVQVLVICCICRLKKRCERLFVNLSSDWVYSKFDSFGHKVKMVPNPSCHQAAA
jgi:hypothetical protein